MRGGEKCLEVFCELFPRAPIYTLLGYPEKVSSIISSREIHASFIQRLPFAEKKYRSYLPFFPRAIESFDVSKYRLILSSSHAVAKGIIPSKNALHISYVHTPMRYVWDMFDQYFSADQVGHVQRAVIKLIAKRLRAWDVKSNLRVHHFIANSEHVRTRIQKHYARDAKVIHPPVDTRRFNCSHNDDGYFLIVSALVPYKRVDLAIDVFNDLKLPLRIIGDGPEMQRLKSRAHDHITFTGWCNDKTLEDAYANCTALLFPGEEDFGIVPVEAMASGKPVIAFGVGGVLETVVKDKTGIFFYEQTHSSLQKAIQKFQSTQFSPIDIRHHALKFDREIFKKKIDEFVREKWSEWTGRKGNSFRC